MYNLCISVHIKTFCIRMNVSSRVCVTDTCVFSTLPRTTHEWVTSHSWLSHPLTRKNESCHIYGCAMSHIHWVTSHTWIRHASRAKACVAVCRSVLQCVAVCRTVSQCVAACEGVMHTPKSLSLYLCRYLCICGVTQGICIWIYMRVWVTRRICTEPLSHATYTQI